MSEPGVRDEIVATREELGDTVEALAHKADVKARVDEAVTERKQQLQHRAQDLRGRPGVLAAAGAALVGLLVAIRAMRRSKR